MFSNISAVPAVFRPAARPARVHDGGSRVCRGAPDRARPEGGLARSGARDWARRGGARPSRAPV